MLERDFYAIPFWVITFAFWVGFLHVGGALFGACNFLVGYATLSTELFVALVAFDRGCLRPDSFGLAPGIVSGLRSNVWLDPIPKAQVIR